LTASIDKASDASVIAPDAVGEFTSCKADSPPVRLNFPDIEVMLPVVVGVVDLDARFIGRTPFVIRNVDAFDEESLPLHSATDVSPN
jgi:hypothetical protein